MAIFFHLTKKFRDEFSEFGIGNSKYFISKEFQKNLPDLESFEENSENITSYFPKVKKKEENYWKLYIHKEDENGINELKEINKKCDVTNMHFSPNICIIGMTSEIKEIRKLINDYKSADIDEKYDTTPSIISSKMTEIDLK
jgi:hypothetical protein